MTWWLSVVLVGGVLAVLVMVAVLAWAVVAASKEISRGLVELTDRHDANQTQPTTDAPKRIVRPGDPYLH